MMMTGGSDIQCECKKLQETAETVEAMWLSELRAYEGISNFNKPNNLASVEEETLFPYHNALYPLLDCFDGLRDNINIAGPAPLPFRSQNGHRRKKTPSVDAHGVEILELDMLDGHLPNSAWAIRHAIMPHHRQDQFANENLGSNNNTLKSNNEHQHQHHQPVREVNEGQRHRNPRFFNILINPLSEITRVASSSISIPPLDDDGLDDDDDSNNWEDINEDNNNDSVDILYSNGNLARNFTFLSWWEQTVMSERRGTTSSTKAAQTTVPSSVLLKVLMHSLSELQSDHRLARAVLLLMADSKVCSVSSSNVKEENDGLECLRRLLSVLSFTYVPCDGYCHESYIAHETAGDLLDDDLNIDVPNHYCSDWWEFLGTLSTLIAYGIENMTEHHASIICAFFMRELGIDHVDSSATESGSDSRHKAYLKHQQNLLFNNDGHERSEDDDPSTRTHVHLLSAILNGIRLHAVSDRMRLNELMNDAGDKTESISTSMTQTSFNACVNILVDIGERILLQLSSSWGNRQLAGLLVRGLLEAFMESSIENTDSLAYYLYHHANDSKLRSVIDPLRYANAVKNAATHPLVDSHCNITSASAKIIGFKPSRDVQDIVKGLFRRDLVDLNVSGCGYGDFLCWCHLPIQPEPLIFDYISNFPQEDDDQEPPQQYGWVQDDDGMELDYPHLAASYDFSLLMLVREWHKPWTPQSHLSFSIPYRKAISSLALCAHRFGVPSSIVEIVNSFLPRLWWYDERIRCWCYDCQLNQLAQLYREKISFRTSNWDGNSPLLQSELTSQTRTGKTLTTCAGCKVAWVCCKDHLKSLYQEGHKRQCGLPPFKPPFSKEDNLLVREIFEGFEDALDDKDIGEDADPNDEDADSWESVDSNSEEGQRFSIHDKIFSWFNDKSYKIQRREAPAPPFAHFF